MGVKMGVQWGAKWVYTVGGSENRNRELNRLFFRTGAKMRQNGVKMGCKMGVYRSGEMKT